MAQSSAKVGSQGGASPASPAVSPNLAAILPVSGSSVTSATDHGLWPSPAVVELPASPEREVSS